MHAEGALGRWGLLHSPFGLSLSKPWVVGVGVVLDAPAGRDVRPAAHLLSFASPKESRQRKGDPAVSDPALRCGQPAVLAGGVRRRTHCALAALRSNSCGESDHAACASCGAPAHPAHCAPRRRQKGVGERTGHRCARPWAETRISRPSAAMARVVPEIPSGRAEKRKGWGGPGQRSMPRLCGLTRCGCLSEAPQARSEFRSAAPGLSIAGCPGAKRRGHGQWGRLSLVPFFGEAKKGTAPPGALPGIPRHLEREPVYWDRASTSSTRTVVSSARTVRRAGQRAAHPTSPARGGA